MNKFRRFKPNFEIVTAQNEPINRMAALEDATHVVICHAKCIDGTSAAAIAYAFFCQPDKTDKVCIVPGVYDTQPPKVTKDQHVYLCDFCYPDSGVAQLIEQAASVTILDHHATAKNAAQKYLDAGQAKGVFDMKRSGAGITFDHFFAGTERPALVNYVEDRDLWKNELPDSQMVSRWLGSMPYEFTHNNLTRWWQVLNRPYSADMQQEVKGITRLMEGLVRSYVDTVWIGEIEFEGKRLKTPMVNCPNFLSSEVLDAILQHEEYQDYPVAVTVFVSGFGDEEASIGYSIRSRESSVPNARQVAETVGGGGHNNASGARIKDKKRINLIVTNLNMVP